MARSPRSRADASPSGNGQPAIAARASVPIVLPDLDDDTRYRGLAARDPRFDGRFVVGVTTTGVYCRPICPARTPGRARCRFFDQPAQAERAGFRACLRCRPELAPGAAPVDAIPRLVAAATARIAAGALNDGSVDALADELGVTARHLRRAVVDALGVSPIELAQSHRLAFAKRLLHDSSLPLTTIAFASGFASVRRFNGLFRARFLRPPGALRRQVAPLDGGLVLRLDYRPPLAWRALLEFLAVRATPGVEVVDVDAGRYARTVAIGAHTGWVEVTAHPDRPALIARLAASLVPVAMPLVARLRGLFDLDAEPGAIDLALAGEPRLRASVRATPGLRVPQAFEAFECCARIVLGQQVSVKGATTLAGRLAGAHGAAIATPHAGLTHRFPTAAELAKVAPAVIAAIGLPGARARTLSGLALAMTGARLERGATIAQLTAVLGGVPGIGPWTLDLCAMRVLGWPDAFPGSDLVVRRALAVPDATAAAAQVAALRPWRAYAAMHLWRIA